MAVDPVLNTGRSIVNDDPRQRYRAAAVGFALAATPSDVAIINGVAGKKVRVLRIEVSGAAATAPQNIPVQIIKRSTANTGGTSAAMTAVPDDSAFSAAAAAAIRYTANGTPGTTVGTVDTNIVCCAVTSSVVAPTAIVFDFTARNNAGHVLNSASEGLAVNLGGVTLANATTLNVVIEWIEE